MNSFKFGPYDAIKTLSIPRLEGTLIITIKLYAAI